MITPTDVYWITRLDAINIGLAVLLFFCCALGLILLFNYFNNTLIGEDEERFHKFCIKIYKPLGIFMIIISTVLLLLPSTQEGVAIYLIPKMANNKQMRDLPINAAKFLNEEFKSYIKDLEKD